MSSKSNAMTDDSEFPNELSSVDRATSPELRHRNNLWRSNYHEASIYIEEGMNNDKFENHPRKRTNLAASGNQTATPPLSSGNQSSNDQHNDQQIQQVPLISIQQSELMQHVVAGEQGQPGCSKQNSKHANYLLGGQYTTIETYILVHNRYFYQLDLLASIVLLILALFEPPAVDGYELSPSIHTAIEMLALGIIEIELLLKFRWMGPRRFFRHGRTVTKLIVLLTMNLEAIVIFLRHSIHARYSRALRPIFLFDNHYCHGMRRAIRQIFQSLPPIIDMFTLALFFMFVFSIFGFYLFATNNSNFSDIPVTIGNLLVLATTANLPDVMMPSYAESRWSTIFFVLFIVIHLFLLTNLTMAAVYESFTRKEKEKFHKLLLHRRKACQKAFKLLVSRREPNRIHYRQFMGLMRYLNRRCSMFDAYLIFKAIDFDKNGSISLEEFYQIYDFINLDWKLIYPEIYWYDHCSYIPEKFKELFSLIRKLLNLKYFEWMIDLLIATSAALQFIEAAAFEFGQPQDQLINLTQFNASTQLITPNSLPTETLTVANDLRPDSISTSIFIGLFTLEAFLRCLAFGLSDYWQSRWNRFDAMVLVLSIGGLISGYFNGPPFGWVIVLRVLRLMRLFEFKKRYRDMWQTLTYILLKRFVSMTCVVMILYYFFAIIGMELLSDYDLRNCCKNTSLESQFKFDNTTTTGSDGPKYYLNDFGDIVASYLTLFSMSSNTYWLATMSAYSIVSGTNWIRLYFGVYYLCSIIVMNIVIAFILESFLFRMHYRRRMGKNCDDTNLFTVRVTLSSYEVDFLRKNLNHYFDKNLDRILSKLHGNSCRLHSSNSNTIQIDSTSAFDGEKTCLIGDSSKARKKLASHEPAHNGNQMKQLNRRIDNGGLKKKKLASDENNSEEKQKQPPQEQPNNERWYLMYQAEQIRNKFSFTMKMYADEVEGWLAEAERADQDEMSLMISRNQIRAEHVAMARLARRSLVASGDVNLLSGFRGRSWSSSSGFTSETRASRQEKQTTTTSKLADKDEGKN